MANMTTILLPHGETGDHASRLTPRLPSIEGRKVGFIDNEMWRSMHILVDEVRKVVTSEYGVTDTEVIFSSPGHGRDPKEYQDRLVGLSQRVDAVVSGLGN